MSATATRPPWSSHSSKGRPHPARSTTSPLGPPPKTPASVGNVMPPLLSPKPPPNTAPSQDPRTPSPNYFGFVVDQSNDPPNSNPGQHTKRNWDYPHSNARNNPIPTPRTVPVEANPDFEAFRRKSESNQFNLSHGNLAQLSRPPLAKQSSRPGPLSPPAKASPTSSQDPLKSASRMEEEEEEEEDAQEPPSFFDMPRRESPAKLSSPPPSSNTPLRRVLEENHHSRLSLPPSNVHKSGSEPKISSLQRAETLPTTVNASDPKILSPQQCADLLESMPAEVLLLDIRVYPQFSQSRIQGSLNLCIPTTLLKRPSFNLQKLTDTFTSDSDKEQFATWEQSKYIIVYDANSATLKDALSPVHVLKKFTAEGWHGTAGIIRGGFKDFAKKCPRLVDNNAHAKGADPAKQTLSIAPLGLGGPNVAGGCPMPTTKSAANPFFGNIRQNMDLIGGVGQMPIQKPSNLSEQVEKALPFWLRQAADPLDKGKLVSDRFLKIEKTEQVRMQEALSVRVSYGSPNPDNSKKVQIAGIEKGAKNRYNNIFPYDHSRVRLQGVPSGLCDYVNASHVKTAYSNKHYIATQAPIPATLNDFWRVVWEQDARVIVMLTAESEGGQLKCHPYWHAGDYGPLKLKVLAEKRAPLEHRDSYSNPQVKRPTLGQRRSTNPHTAAEKNSVADVKMASETPFIVIRHFTLSHSAYPFQPMREITQLQYSHWPDFGAPAHPTHLLNLLEQTSKVVRGTMSPGNAIGPDEPEPPGQRPVVVHCSAGCGRTGTFCTVDSVIDMLKRQRTERPAKDGSDMDIDSQDDWLQRDDQDLVAKAVEDFRADRLSMVQSLRQFVLCYETVLEWIASQQPEAAKREGARRSYQG